MSDADIAVFFSHYAAASTRGDVTTVVEAWSLPATISTAEHGPVVLADSGAFRRNTDALCAFYAREGVTRAEKRVVSIQRLSATAASVIAAGTLSDASGRPVAMREHGYLVRSQDGRIAAFAAVADGEVAAWSARGTSLGS